MRNMSIKAAIFLLWIMVVPQASANTIPLTWPTAESTWIETASGREFSNLPSTIRSTSLVVSFNYLPDSELVFNQTFDTTFSYDGVFIERYNGTAWKIICEETRRDPQCDTQAFLKGSSYTGVVKTGTGNPHAYKPAWYGAQTMQVVAKFNVPADSQVLIRFRYSGDYCCEDEQTTTALGGEKKASWKLSDLYLVGPPPIVAPDPAPPGDDDTGDGDSNPDPIVTGGTPIPEDTGSGDNGSGNESGSTDTGSTDTVLQAPVLSTPVTQPETIIIPVVDATPIILMPTGTTRPIVIKRLTWRLSAGKVVWVFNGKTRPIVRAWADKKIIKCKVRKVNKNKWTGVCKLPKKTKRYCIQGPGQKKVCKIVKISKPLRR